MSPPNDADRQPPPPGAGMAFFLDLDGTLLEIAETPNAVYVSPELLELLQALYRATGGAVAVVSGRAISDLDRRLGKLNLPRAGQHGLERRDAKGRLSLHAASLATKETIQAALTPLLQKHVGLALEDKFFTLALHYRQAPELEDIANQAMEREVAAAGGGYVVQKGKCVIEAKPGGIDKGLAIEAFIAEAPFRDRQPVFIGDDLNDEYGFAAVNRLGGWSIKVGNGESCARYRLPDVPAVLAWLAGALPRQ